MKTIRYSILAMMFCGLQGCVDLDTAPYNQVASNNMWSNSSLTNQGVAGVYAKMRDWGVYSTSYSYNVVPFECLGMTGEAYRSIPYTSGTAGSDNGFFSGMWKNLYEGVHRANDAIANLSEPGQGGVDEESRLRLLSECKFMRAYYYTRLNELYGRYGLGVPVYTEPLSSVGDCTKGQSPESEVWNLIVQDLTDCINEPNFPDRYQEKGRACKGAAYALRGRAYLMQGAKYNYNNAVGKVEDTTIDTGLLRLAVADFEKVQGCGFDLFLGGYKELFTEANEDCVEMIFSLQNISKPGYGSAMQKYCGTRSMIDHENSTGFSYYAPSAALVDLYEYKDGTPFDWNDIIPGYFDVPAIDRLVYFLRNTIVDGKEVSTGIQNAIQNKLNGKKIADQYLPAGNEERLKKAWENRDPRLNYNVILPYGEVYLGGDADMYKVGNTTPVPYVFRWPVKQSNHSVKAQESADWGVHDIYDLRQDGSGEAEFAYRHRKFVMEGYDCEYATANPIDEPILRYAYVLLMWAEALVQLDDLDGAAEKVNLIRGRASVEMPPYTFANKEDGLNKIRNESRRELVNESVNFYEELRWGTLRETKYSTYMGYEPCAHTCNGIQSSGNGGVKWSESNDYSIFPVPSGEIEKNPNLKKTPGWLY
mgnify:FL=1